MVLWIAVHVTRCIGVGKRHIAGTKGFSSGRWEAVLCGAVDPPPPLESLKRVWCEITTIILPRVHVRG